MPFDIRAAVVRLKRREESITSGLAKKPAILQFDGLLTAAMQRFPDSIDIQELPPLKGNDAVWQTELNDALERLSEGLDVVVDESAYDTVTLSQKFGILRAEPQLALDFEAYATEDTSVALLFFDIDHFKALNTEFTETLVDSTVLAPFQRFLVQLLQHRGFGYSVGGDEFLAFLRNVAPLEAAAFGERLRREAADLRFPVGSRVATITLSIGVACYPTDGTSLADLRSLANKAENVAKKGGRNRVSLSWELQAGSA